MMAKQRGRLSERQNVEPPNAVEFPVLVTIQTVVQLLEAAGHVERAGQVVPDGQDESQVLVVVLGITTVVDLMLGRAD